MNYFKNDYHVLGYEHMSEQDIIREVRTLLHVLPRGRAKRLVVGMCDEFEISHNEPKIEYGALTCCSCYGCPPMILDNELSSSEVATMTYVSNDGQTYYVSGSHD